MKVNLEIHLTSDRYKALARSITQRYGLECNQYDMPQETFIPRDKTMYNIGEIYPNRWIFQYNSAHNLAQNLAQKETIE